MTDPVDDSFEPPLDALAAAWGAIEPPAPTAPLGAPDATTRAAVDWMARAWQATAEPPAPRLPWRLRARPLLRHATPFLATAAALLLWVRFAATDLSRIETPPAEPLVALSASIPITHVAADRTELRSGRVRLILLTPPEPPPVPGPSQESPR
ncbi:MAG: hypothetical protein JNL90_15635 [Planctomycetes bacterium]|nr:hypothetical protein [Planctomycetota bacterium]